MKLYLVRKLMLAAGAILIMPNAFANTSWVGTADYTAAPGAVGDEASVGPFDTYDFGPGIGLVKPDTTVATGNTFTGYFQTVVTSHIFDATALNVGQLDVSGGANFSGTGNGFELTVRSFFTGQYTNVSPSSLDVVITGGTAGLYFDSNPNYSFANDFGFADGASILSGTITGGVGSIFAPAVIGVGFEQISLDFSGVFGGFNADVYEPDTIAGGTALFSVKVKTALNNTPVINQVAGGANKVGGVSAVGGQLFEMDGQMQLTAVPLPGAAWMFLSALAGLLSVGRKNRFA